MSPIRPRETLSSIKPMSILDIPPSTRAPLSQRGGAEARNKQALRRAITEQERSMILEESLKRDGYSFRLLPGARESVPEEFLEHPYEYALSHGDVIKDEPDKEEIVWKFPGTTNEFVLKRIQDKAKRLPSLDHELRMLQRAKLLDLPAPTPLGLMTFDHDGPSFLLMDFEPGVSGVDLYDKFLKTGDRPEEVERKLDIVCKKLKLLAERFRAVMFVDKKWYVKDCLIRLDRNGDVADVFPLDWELAHPYNPDKPEAIDTLDKIMERRRRQK